ncbi:MAG: hypothetical protein M1832_005477 [Thelocarpon impressellum]|nr:MAG: hypothetical protein M1832_005477 [Thelocarpon impressellum]
MSDVPSLPRRFLPQPVESSVKVRRSRAAPRPEESPSDGAARARDQTIREDQASAPRRFLPQPVESSVRSRRSKVPATEEASVKQDEPVGAEAVRDEETGKGGPRRFAPEPVETSKKSSRKKPPGDVSRKDERQARADPDTTKSPGRRFLPQLIETTKRSRRSGDDGPTILPPDKTEASPGDALRSLQRLRGSRPGLRASSASTSSVPRMQDYLVTHHHHSTQSRRHSFIIPSLEPIASSESEGSNCPSLSTSPSASSEGSSDLSRHAKKMRESCDDRFSGYLLDLAARAAEKQLREQAMAAFPNDDYHEPVDHFAIDRDSEASEESGGIRLLAGSDRGRDMRRSSTAEISWEAQEMQRHQAKLDLQRHQQERGHDADDSSARVMEAFVRPDQFLGVLQKETGLDQMRQAANPPMLGRDLVFVKYLSPKATRLEVDQNPCSVARRRKDGGGLWMGFCAAGDEGLHTAKPIPSLLVTPVDEIDDPMDVCDASGPASKAVVEAQLDVEYSDAFVTQVYNYLSLGYPSLARKFDHELSKISRVPAEELCRHDAEALAKGFVGLDEGQGADQDGVTGGRCGRWKALRLYIREWARQNPGMTSGADSELDNWGDRGRRGSWAI